MKAPFVIAALAAGLAATPLVSAGPDTQCSAEPPAWYEVCQPIADEINCLADRPNECSPVPPEVWDLILCLTFDRSKCPT